MKQTIVITGASSGIGRALALEFAQRGYHLGLAARRLAPLAALRGEILAQDASLRIAIAAVDVADDNAVASGLGSLFRELDGVDIVIANAGINALTDVGQDDLRTESQMIQTNLTGAIATVNAAVGHFLQRGGGHVVGISSLASLQPVPRQAAYCASKAGFSMYLKAARIELRKKNIAVSDIMPGYVQTNIVEGVDTAKLPFSASPQQVAREMADLIERRRKSGIVPGFPWKFIRPLLGRLPERFTAVSCAVAGYVAFTLVRQGNHVVFFS